MSKPDQQGIVGDVVLDIVLSKSRFHCIERSRKAIAVNRDR
jgi:hypothetical protein